MKTIGRHLIVELYGCDVDRLDSVNTMRQHLLEAARIIGATVMGEVFHRFAPHGVSGTVVISESHLSVHTWPENGYVAIDIYTCGGLDPRPGFRYLARALKAKNCRLQEILRGLPEDLDEQVTLMPEDVQVITRTAVPIELATV
ncbi:MAG: adenosylmethionine decarboxylase [Planctomycetota bacterium]